jgi:LacI family transcriptional regulator
MALGASRAIVSRGLTVGIDVSLIAHDDVLPFLKAEQMHPALTTTRSSIRKAGAEISKMVLQHVHMPQDTPQQTVWPVELVVRDSTGPVRTR